MAHTGKNLKVYSLYAFAINSKCRSRWYIYFKLHFQVMSFAKMQNSGQLIENFVFC